MPEKTTAENYGQLEIPGRVSFATGAGDLPVIRVKTKFSTAEIYLHGAHVTAFQKNGEPPLLFLSKESHFAEGQAIRGGIPVILPWFGARAGEASHGFARTKSWVPKETSVAKDGSVSVRLQLPACAEMTKWTPFTAEYIVTVGETLKLQLAVTNSSTDKELTFEDCLHTYFSVGDIDAVTISGLKGTQYLDKVEGMAQKTETNDVIQVSSEVDRVYVDTTSAVEIHDAKLRRVIQVAKEGSNATVVWNPWIAKSQQLSDFGDEEYKGMVCVESGNVGKNKIVLAPGKTSKMTVTLGSRRLE